MKKILSLALALVMVLGLVPATMAADATTTLYKAAVAPVMDGVISADEYSLVVDATGTAHTNGDNAPKAKYYLTWNDTDLYLAIEAQVSEVNYTSNVNNFSAGVTGVDTYFFVGSDASGAYGLECKTLFQNATSAKFTRWQGGATKGSHTTGGRLSHKVTENEDGSYTFVVEHRYAWNHIAGYTAPAEGVVYTIGAKFFNKYGTPSAGESYLASGAANSGDMRYLTLTLSAKTREAAPVLDTDVSFNEATGTVTFLNEDAYVCKVNGEVVEASALTNLAPGSVVEIARAGDGTTTADSIPLTITLPNAEEEEEEVDLGPSATPKPNPVTPGLNPGLTPGNPTVIPNPAPSSVPFTDVDEDDWYYEDLVYVVDAGLMNGVGGNKFAPQSDLDRAMLVTVLWRLAGEPTVNVNTFDDVSYRDWFSSAVNWAAEEGIVKGYAGCFNPTDGITREQVAAILHRYADMMGYKSSSFSNRYYKTSDWAAEDVAWADANDLLDIATDMEDMTEIATRAEIAALLANFCRTFVD